MAGQKKIARSGVAFDASEFDDSPSEHIYIGSEDMNPNPAAAARTVREQVTLRNPLRRTRLAITLYEEGVVEIAEQRNGKPSEPLRLDLHFLDPVPTLQRVIAARWLYAALGCAGLMALATFLMRFEALRIVALPTLLAAALAGLVTLSIGLYRSYEKTEFRTLHGRAPVLRLIANLGSIRKFRAFVPVLCGAIEESADLIGDDTSAYLRAEMREHYRLRGAGVLDYATCAECTGRILAQFDVRL